MTDRMLSEQPTGCVGMRIERNHAWSSTTRMRRRADQHREGTVSPPSSPSDLAAGLHADTASASESSRKAITVAAGGKTQLTPRQDKDRLHRGRDSNMKADAHPRQHERLKALYSFDILDTAPEREFDDVVQLAARVCDTEIAVINLIDAERQWFKSETGLGVRETPLETSLCSHAILEEDFLEIHDTRHDDRMKDNPLCLGVDGLRFYAGALLKTDDGLPIGTLCVLDRKPRTLTELQRDALRVLSRQVVNQLNLRLALKTADILRREVDHRVKNSFQMVAALVRLQASATSTEEARAALNVVGGRIETLAALHEQLYSTDEDDQIDLARYVRKVVGFISRTRPEAIEVEVSSDSVKVSSQQASSIGIIINEFATNSFKHAFRGRQQGRVTFTIQHLAEEDQICLTCEDDGVGLRPSDAGTSGLGMKIAGAVGAQLGGTITVGGGASGGARLCLRFPTAG